MEETTVNLPQAADGKRRQSLLTVGVIFFLLAGGLQVLSLTCGWECPKYGILILGQRTDVILFIAALILMSLSFSAASVGRLPRVCSFLSRIFLSAATVTLVLGIIEWYLNRPQNAELTVPDEIAVTKLMQVEPGVGYRHKPNMSVSPTLVTPKNIFWWTYNGDILKLDERNLGFYTDKYGFRNRKDPEECDVYAVGDSFTLGADVEENDSWVSILSKDLKLDIYNLGVTAFCPSQELEIYRRYGNRGNPRGVLIGVFGINDLTEEDNYAGFLGSKMIFEEWSACVGGKVYLAEGFAFTRFLRKRFLKQQIREYHRFSGPEKPLKPVRVVDAGTTTEISYYPPFIMYAYYAASRDLNEYLPAKNMVKALRSLAEDCSRQGRALAVLYFPAKQTVHPPDPTDQEEWLNAVSAFVPECKTEGWSREQTIEAGRKILTADIRLEEHLAGICGKMGIPFLSLRPGLAKRAKETGELLYYHYDTHWNEKGNRCVAEAVAEWLKGQKEWGVQ